MDATRKGQVTRSAADIYEEAGIIMISPASTNPKVTDEGGPNVFRVIGRDDQQGTIAGDYLADNYGNLAILYWSAGRKGVAEAFFFRALALFAQLGDTARLQKTRRLLHDLQATAGCND